MSRMRIASVLIVAAIGACTAAPTPSPTGSSGPGSSHLASEPAGSAPEPSPGSPSVAPATQPPLATEQPSGPASSALPIVDWIQVAHTASCSSDNGTGTVGLLRITWSASGTTGVRISIDPPSPDVAYDYGFADYPPSGFADVPFACDPPSHDAKGAYHLYVVTTLKVGGHAFFRYARVYDATPAPTAP